MLILDAIGLVAGAMLAGAWLVRLAVPAANGDRGVEHGGDGGARAAARGRRTARSRAELALAALVACWALVCAVTGRWWPPEISNASGILAAAHVVAASAWLGALARFAVCLGDRASADAGMSRGRALTRMSAFSLFLLAIVGATVLAASRALDGWPALVGTRYGRWLLLQSALFATALGLTALAAARLPRRNGVDHASSPDAAPSKLRAGGLSRGLAIQVAGGAAMVVTAVMLARLSDADDSTRWPFRSRPAPGVMLRIPGAVDAVISGTGIALLGVLALIGARRFKDGRPLLLAGGALFLGIGLYQALAAVSIDAYPTTYARPAVAADAASIRRGHSLFAMHCAACHGRAGRGDGPAGAGLLQRPADLTASHTADHLPGDLFWWITHGLGLAMPAFGDRLSVAERWDLVNFVRTLGAGRESPAAAR